MSVAKWLKKGHEGISTGIYSICGSDIEFSTKWQSVIVDYIGKIRDSIRQQQITI